MGTIARTTTEGAVWDAIVAAGGEVDGIPISYTAGELSRLGMFCLKEDDPKGEDSQVSNDDSLWTDIGWFCDTSPIGHDAFYSYDEARHWGHP